MLNGIIYKMTSGTSKKHKKSEVILICCYVIILITLCLIKAWQVTYTSDFSPINGDFQNYNPIRRLLAGQIPYRDFPVYLGAGHLYIGASLVWLFGNSFTACLFSMEFFTVFCFELWIFVIAYVIIQNKLDALFLSMGYTLINIIRPEIFVSNLIPDILSSLDAGLTVGNSARLIRSTAAIILAIIVLLGSKLLFKLSDKSQWVRNHFSVIMKVLAAFLLV